MSLFTRIVDLSKAAVHEALNKLEHPEMMLNHYVRTMEEEIASVQQALGKQLAEERSLKARIDDYNRLAEQSEKQAIEALAEDRTAEARLALEHKLRCLDQAAEYSFKHETARQRSAELMRQLEEAKAELAVMQEKRSELAARAQQVSAKAQASMSGSNRGGEAGSAARGFRRIEEQIRYREAQAELAGRPHPQAEGPASKDALARREAYIEEQLTKLRKVQPSH